MKNDIDTEMRMEGDKENQFDRNRRSNASTSRNSVHVFITLVLLLGLSALSVLTLQSLNKMQRLEKTVSDLEIRILEIEEVCRTAKDGGWYDDDEEDDSDDDTFSMLPTGTLENAVIHISASTLTGSQMESPANATYSSAVGLSEGVSIRDGRQKRQTGTESNKRKKEKKPKKKVQRTAAHFHLNMPGSDSQFYQSVAENVLFPWVANQHKKRLMNLPYKYLSDSKGIAVSRKGLYFIYTQVAFHNNAPHNIAAINVNGINVAQCTQSTHKMKVDVESSGMFANCFTAVVRYLEKEHTVQIKSLYRNRQILTRSKNTFFGLVKLA